MNKVLGTLLICSALLFLSGCDKKGDVSEKSENISDVTPEETCTVKETAVTETNSTVETTNITTDILFDDDGEVIIINDIQDSQGQISNSENSSQSGEEKSEPENTVSENIVSEDDDGVIVLPFIPLD